VLNSERFCDKAPAEVWATLLDVLKGAQTHILHIRQAACRRRSLWVNLMGSVPNRRELLAGSRREDDDVTSVAARGAMNQVCGPLPCRRSGGPLVLVNHASENGVSTDHGVEVRFGARDRHHKAEPAMRSTRVVVPDVAPKNPLEMATRDDEEEVEALLTSGPHPPLGVRVRARRANRRADDLGAFRGERPRRSHA